MCLEIPFHLQMWTVQQRKQGLCDSPTKAFVHCLRKLGRQAFDVWMMMGVRQPLSLFLVVLLPSAHPFVQFYSIL